MCRGNYKNDVLSLVAYFRIQIGDHTTATSFNAFGGVRGVDIDLGDFRCACINYLSTILVIK